jgi:hypothetical protein
MDLHFHPDDWNPDTGYPAARRFTCTHPKSDPWDIRVGWARGWCWTCAPLPTCAPFYGDPTLVQIWCDFEDLRTELWSTYGGDPHNAPKYPYPGTTSEVSMARSPEQLTDLLNALPPTIDGETQKTLLSLAVMGGTVIDAFVLFEWIRRGNERFVERLDGLREMAAQLVAAEQSGEVVEPLLSKIRETIARAEGRAVVALPAAALTHKKKPKKVKEPIHAAQA